MSVHRDHSYEAHYIFVVVQWVPILRQFDELEPMTETLKNGKCEMNQIRSLPTVAEITRALAGNSNSSSGSEADSSPNLRRKELLGLMSWQKLVSIQSPKIGKWQMEVKRIKFGFMLITIMVYDYLFSKHDIICGAECGICK